MPFIGEVSIENGIVVWREPIPPEELLLELLYQARAKHSTVMFRSERAVDPDFIEEMLNARREQARWRCGHESIKASG
jgi:hypothetical protein